MARWVSLKLSSDGLEILVNLDFASTISRNQEKNYTRICFQAGSTDYVDVREDVPEIFSGKHRFDDSER